MPPRKSLDETEIKGITPKLLWRGLMATVSIIIAIISSTAYIVKHMDGLQEQVNMNDHRISSLEKWRDKQEAFNVTMDSRVDDIALRVPIDNLRTSIR